VLCLGAGVLTACTPEAVTETEDIPTAGVRFVNAVPDTFAVDFRPVDIVENSTFYSVAFRNTTLLAYKNARAGSRHFRIFQSGITPEIASVVVKDTTVTLEAGKRYTFILWGCLAGSAPARGSRCSRIPWDPGADRLPGGERTDAAIDARIYPNGGTVPGSATWSAVALPAPGYQYGGGADRGQHPAGGGGTSIQHRVQPAWPPVLST
jgi:hypothetical protein